MRSIFFSSLLLAALSPLSAAETKPTASSISELVSRTLAANPEIRFYEAEIATAKATRSTAGRLSNPELSLEVGQNRVSSADSRSNGLAFSAALAQPIEWPGRLGLRKAIANRDIALAELGLERFRFHLASRVRVLAYTLAAAVAGAAGALMTQTTGFASLDLFEFHRSADVMLILVIGGTGWLYGGVAGAIVFKLMQDFLASITPQYWMFWIGLFLVVLVLVGRDRLIRPWTWLGKGQKGQA